MEKQEEQPKLPPINELANPSCKYCYGTGICAEMPLGEDKRVDGKIQRAPRMPITCSCVKRAMSRKAPWLQRYGKDRQPWLQS